jgi:hypothetical protein
MKKIAQSIVRLRKLILTVAVLLLIPSAIGAVATRINYDVLTYLPQELDSMIGERALEDDFHLASTGMITVEGLPTNELIAILFEPSPEEHIIKISVVETHGPGLLFGIKRIDIFAQYGLKFFVGIFHIRIRQKFLLCLPAGL